MLLRELFYRIPEGGWDSVATQGTVVKPAVVKAALSTMSKFAKDFNAYLAKQGLGPIQVGHPTGSSAYYEVDPEDKIYGDVDLQMIAPETSHATHSQFQGYWNSLADQFIKTTNPQYIHDDPEAKPGHPIVQIGPDQYVQVDFMWHMEKTRDWGRYRATPERGVKGLLNGNMFSVLGSLLGMSIQHAGVQLKVVKGMPVSFSKQKDTEVVTVSTNPKTFVYDILTYLFERQHGSGQPHVDPLLKQYPGVTTDMVKVSSLVNAVKGLSKSFELNNMYGQGLLSNYSSADDFINSFWSLYEQKAIEEIGKAKRDKATTPDAIARAEDDKKKIMQGLEMIKGLFGQDSQVSESGAALSKLGVEAKRIVQQQFIDARKTLDPILKKAGIKTPHWTMGSAGSWAPEHPYYDPKSVKTDAGDIDVMVDADELIQAFPPAKKVYKKEPSVEKRYADELKSSKEQFSEWLSQHGIPNTGAALNLSFNVNNDNVQVDLIVKKEAGSAIHGHQMDYSKDVGMRGSDLWLKIWPTLIKMTANPLTGDVSLGTDPKTGETISALQLSPDRGVVDRKTGKVIYPWSEKDKIAELMVGPGVSGRDISSLSGIKAALQKVNPKKWNAVEQFFPQPAGR